MSKRQYEDKTISKINQDQLTHTNNGVFVEKFLDDSPKDFAVLDDVTIGTKGESEMSPHYSETKRYAISIEINDCDYRKNLGNRQK
jgi:hypothetical protein